MLERACPAGTRGDGGNLHEKGRACRYCESGYASDAGSPGCSTTKSGYMRHTGTRTFVPCAAGYYCNSNIANNDVYETNLVIYNNPGTGPYKCTPGYFSPAGASLCTECAPGKYSDFERNEICFGCGPVGYNTIYKATGCSGCPAGKVSNVYFTGCDFCAQGSYRTAAMTAGCQYCPAGKVSLADRSDCVFCQNGYYRTATMTACSICAAGQNPAADSASCVNCLAGTYNPNPGGLCSNCVGPTYSGVGAQSCTDCPPGSYTEDHKTCPWCAPGKTNSGGTTQCFDCAAGTKGVYLSTGAPSCEDCPASQYQNEEGKTACKTCAAGNTPGVTCKSTGGKCTGCVEVGPGSFSANGVSELCSAGTYTNTKGKFACDYCPANQYTATSTTGNSACISCKDGYVAQPNMPKSSGTSCKQCASDPPSNGVTSQSHFADTTGVCVLCTDGYMCSWGQRLDKCNAGSYSVGGKCNLCKAGTYSNQGKSSCTTCPAGTCSTPGAAFCDPCPAGYKCINGIDYPCNEGYYQPSTGQSYCEKCPKGSKCPSSNTGLTEPTPCPPGPTTTYTLPGSAYCFSCTSEEYSDQSSVTGCSPRIPCPPGHWADLAKRDPALIDTCIEHSTPCNTGFKEEPCTTGSPRICNRRVQYIVVQADGTHDWVCVPGPKPCIAGQYLLAPLTDTVEGFIVRPQECATLTVCNAGYYELAGQTLTGIINRMCGKKHIPDYSIEYKVSDAVDPYHDHVYAPLTRCITDPTANEDGSTEYLLRMHTTTRDNTCAPVLQCDTFRTQYVLSPAKDATSPTVDGKQVQCAGYRTCSPGRRSIVPTDPQADMDCSEKCPAGTYGSVYKINNFTKAVCVTCPDGTYSTISGATICLGCTDCTKVSTTDLNAAYGPCPAQELCVKGELIPCNATTDTECMWCPQTSWNFHDDTLLCEPCQPGYHYLSQYPALLHTHRCVKCPPGHYCMGSTVHAQCQNPFIVQNSGQAYLTLPYTLAGATSPGECNCSYAGGFYGRGSGILGCVPCPNGTYALPGQTACTECPIGKYSNRVLTRDYFASPISTSPTAVWEYAVKGMVYTNVQQSISIAQAITTAWQNKVSATTAIRMTWAGATTCTTCPQHIPYTLSTGTPGVSQCRRCQAGRFYSQVQAKCVTCTTTQCTPPLQLVEPIPCTDTTDQMCEICISSACASTSGVVGGIYTASLTIPGKYLAPCVGDVRDACRSCSNAPTGIFY